MRLSRCTTTFMSGAVVVRGRFAQDFATGPQLVQNLFEPKLVGLVHDDEKHFIVRLNFAVFETDRLLEREQFVDCEVSPVILIERTLHPGLSRTAQGGVNRRI